MKNIIVEIKDEERNLIREIEYRHWERRWLQAAHARSEFPSDDEIHQAFCRFVSSYLVEELFYHFVPMPDFDQDELYHPSIPPDSEL